MLKFSGYPYPIRGQPEWKFERRVRPEIRANLFHNAEIPTVQPADLKARARSPPPKAKRGLSGVMTLERACPPEYQGAQCAFKDSMIH
jgi:hypothetical protein